MMMKVRFATLCFLSILSLVSCSTMRRVTVSPVDVTAPVYEDIEPQWRTMAKVVAINSGCTLSDGNGIVIYTDGEALFTVLEDDIKSAAQSIEMEYYRFSNDKVATHVRNLLMEKGIEGTDVKVILETRANPIDKKYYSELGGTENVSTVKVQPLWELPSRIYNVFYRDHRKITVIDGKVAYTGGMNIRDVYRYDWRDTQVRVTGPVVEDFRRTFYQNWSRFNHEAEAPAAPAESTRTGKGLIMQFAGDSPYLKSQPIMEGVEQALAAAKAYIYIQTPYLCPPQSTLRLMEKAAKRGVDVRLMLPDTQDVPIMLQVNRSFYRRLLKSGVKIYEREEPFMHCKSFVADDYVSCYGSANLDNRSFKLNFENTLYIYDEGTAKESRRVFEEDLSHSREITLEDARWPFWESVLQGLAIGIGYSQW